ncbi:hypothetical protein BC826DRAFT_1035121 [Russula brevipes]|nr:hypothetical protein BC826DRAFT_1035121 [Russula brevipes]
MLSAGAPGLQAGWTIISGPSYPHEITQPSSHLSHQPASPFTHPVWPNQHPNPNIQSATSSTEGLSIDGGVGRLSLTRERSHNARYSPYPSPSLQTTSAPLASNVSSPVGTSRIPFSDTSGRVPDHQERIQLPPLQPPPSAHASGQAVISLPPISSWAAAPHPNDSRMVLQRLRANDNVNVVNPLPTPGEHQRLSYRRCSSSAPSDAQRLDLETPKLFKSTLGAETQHWTSERSCSQDSAQLQTLAYRRPSDSSSAVSSTSASFLSSTPDAVSPSDPSPVLPLTPHTSAPLSREPPHGSLPSTKELSGNNRAHGPSRAYIDASRPVFANDRDRLRTYGRHRGGDHTSLPQRHRVEESPTHEPAQLWDKYGTNYPSSHPVRPW